MRRLSVWFLVLLIIVLFSPSVLATEGACAWHGGVNCSAGSNIFGGVICNDGWLDSSVTYNSMSACGATLNTLCPQPLVSGYTSLYLCDQQQAICDRQNDSRKVFCARHGMSSDDPNCQLVECAEASACREQVSNYNSQVEAHNMCVQKEMDYLKSKFEYEQQKIMEANEKIAQLSKLQKCRDQFGINAIPATQDGQCRCNEGYVFGSKDQCISKALLCFQELGLNSKYDEDAKKCIATTPTQFPPLSTEYIKPPFLSLASSSSLATTKERVKKAEQPVATSLGGKEMGVSTQDTEQTRNLPDNIEKISAPKVDSGFWVKLGGVAKGVIVSVRGFWALLAFWSR